MVARGLTFLDGKADGEPPMVQVHALCALRNLHTLCRIVLIHKLDKASSSKITFAFENLKILRIQKEVFSKLI